MTKRLATVASLCLLALGIAAFTGSALAGNGNGNQAASETGPGNSENAAGHNKDATTAQGAADQNAGTQAGVKPTDATAKGNKPTMCSTGGGQGSSATCTATGSNAATADTAAKPDQSKRYGNGSTAAQIANSRGAPSGTNVYGPGNSQPHKVLDCKRQHWVDVHAVKSYTTTCSATTSGTTSGTTAGTTAARVSAHASGSTAQGASPTGGVLGVTASGGSSGPIGGVLGAIASAGSGVLPFTGFPLWIVVASGLGLLLLGLALRGRGGMTA